MIDTPCRLQLLLPECAVVLEPVRVRGPADDRLAPLPKRHGLLALSERVVEDDDVGPVHVAFPVVDLGDEAVGDRRSASISMK